MAMAKDHMELKRQPELPTLASREHIEFANELPNTGRPGMRPGNVPGLDG